MYNIDTHLWLSCVVSRNTPDSNDSSKLLHVLIYYSTAELPANLFKQNTYIEV